MAYKRTGCQTRGIWRRGLDPRREEIPELLRRNHGCGLSPLLRALFLLGMATAAMAATGEFGNRCAMGLAMGKDIPTDCSVSAPIGGKTYCFIDKVAMFEFQKDPPGNLAKAQANYSKLKL